MQDYQDVFQQTKRSAAKLVASIKGLCVCVWGNTAYPTDMAYADAPVYLSLQKDITGDETDAMIIELDSLKAVRVS